MKRVTYQPLWLLEALDFDTDVLEQRLVTKDIFVRSERGMYSTGIFTKEEQIALGQDIYNISNLRAIYQKASEETFDLLARLVHAWQFHTVLNKLRGVIKK